MPTAKRKKGTKDHAEKLKEAALVAASVKKWAHRRKKLATRLKRDVPQREVAKAAGIARLNYDKLERLQSLPKPVTFKKVEAYFKRRGV